MKKLLALVLCVMMFVSVLPTAAFAGNVLPDIAVNTVSSYNTQIKNMIKNTKKSIENSYKALAGDKVVYTSAKAMDDAIVALVNNIADPLIAKNKFDKTRADIVKAALRAYFDEAVAENIADNYYKALDGDGNRDDLKYAQVVSNAMSKALNDKTFIAGYQAVATYFALATLASDMKDAIKDEYDAFHDSIDSKFEETFAKNYTTLVDEYIDTLATGTAKALTNYALWDALQDELEDAADARDAIVDPLAEQLAEKKEDLATDLATDKATAKAPVTAAQDNLADAEKELAKAEIMKKADPTIDLKPYQDAVKDAEKDLAAAQKQYNKDIKDLDEQYEKDLAALDAQYAVDTFDAEYDYELAVAAAKAVYDLGVEDINPWAEYVLPEVGSWK